MLRHTVLFSRSRVTFAISSHSAANRRNRSDVSIGRPPCFVRYLRKRTQSPLKGSGTPPAQMICNSLHTVDEPPPRLRLRNIASRCQPIRHPCGAPARNAMDTGAENQVPSPQLCCSAGVRFRPEPPRQSSAFASVMTGIALQNSKMRVAKSLRRIRCLNGVINSPERHDTEADSGRGQPDRIIG